MRGGAGHGQFPAAGCGVFHRFSDGEREGGGYDLFRPRPGELAACTKADKLLTEGDTVSARGFGKFQLAVVGGVTKKGRTAIVVKRYI